MPLQSSSGLLSSLLSVEVNVLQLGSEGKRLRPTILLLMASSLSAAVPPATTLEVDLRPPATHITDHRRRQQRIAEVSRYS